MPWWNAAEARRVVLCAATTGYQIRSFSDAAAKLGVRLVFVSDRCDQLDDPWWDQAIPARFHMDDASVDAVTRALAADPPAAVLAVGDRPVVLAARIAHAFGLDAHPPAAAAASRNKLATRQALRDAGLAVPEFSALEASDDASMAASPVPYPAVVKPLQLSGSRGVMRVDNGPELASALARLRRILDSPDVRAERDPAHRQVLIETFIPGAEVAVEGVLTRGRLAVFAIFDKPDPLDGPFFEETIYVTPSRHHEAVRRAVAAQVAAAARAIGLHHGPIHAECRVNPGGVYVLEIAARPIGGLCSRAVRLTGGDGELVSLEEALLRHALGDDVTSFEQPASASGVMMVPIPRGGVYKGVAGEEAARAVDGIEDIRITAKPDTVLVPLPEGRSYLGFIFASGPSPHDVERSLRDAHARLQFRIERELPVG
jgi:biotin carboxylase